MNPIITAILIYLVGVIVAAFGIRYVNSKEKHKYNCFPPHICLLSWLIVLVLCIVTPIFNICEYVITKIDYKDIEKFFNCTTKE